MLEIKYGALPPKKDVRDYKLTKSVLNESEYPESYSCISTNPTIKNQKQVSSCVAHATSSILEHYIDSKKLLSTNFIYGIQNKVCGHDGSGMYLRDACSIVKTYGDMTEEDCPGNDEVPDCWSIAESALQEKEKADNAVNFKIDKYVSLKSDTDIKRFIITYGPALASIKWYNNFTLSNKDILQGDKKGDYGYHAIAIVGWNKNGFICQNSWGEKWGDKGYFTLPYSIGVAECFGLVDDSTLGIFKEPKRNRILNIFYKLFNFIINIFYKK